MTDPDAPVRSDTLARAVSVRRDPAPPRQVAFLLGLVAVACVGVLLVGGRDGSSGGAGRVPLLRPDLQARMRTVMAGDPRNEGVEVRVGYAGLFDSEVLVYDLIGVSGDNSQIDVFRVFLQFAQASKDLTFRQVELRFRGAPRFLVPGTYFKRLGEEYSWQNPVYTVNHFPENVLRPDGTSAFPTWTGGWLGVAGKQLEDVASFHRQWYLDDLLRE